MFLIKGILEYLLIVAVVAIPSASILYTVITIVSGRYLNRYYVFSPKGNGVFELHCNPAFGYYYGLPGSYFEIREDAVRKFKKRCPHGQLYAVSSTLQGFYAREGIPGTPIAETRFKRQLGKVMNYFLIMRNLANYRKRDGHEWQVAHLIRRVKHATPHRYDL